MIWLPIARAQLKKHSVKLTMIIMGAKRMQKTIRIKAVFPFERPSKIEQPIPAAVLPPMEVMIGSTFKIMPSTVSTAGTKRMVTASHAVLALDSDGTVPARGTRSDPGGINNVCPQPGQSISQA